MTGQAEPSFLLIPTPLKTAAYTASPQDMVLCDTSGGSFTVTLPAAPRDLTQISVMLGRTASGNVVTVAAATGDAFAGGGTTWPVAAAGQCLALQYDAAAGAWITTGGVAAVPSVYQPWQFQPETYGAKGDVKIVTDGAVTASGHTLTCATSAPFTPADVGKHVHVGNALGSYVPLITTITGFTDSAHVTLAAAATASASSAITVYGTDDTAAVQAAVNAAVAWAQAHNGQAQVLLGDRLYGIAGNPVVGGSTLGNAQITLPLCAAGTVKVTLTFKGACDVNSSIYWEQLTPQAAGSFLVCLNASGTNDGTYGPSYMIGGPYDGYGPVANVWNNLSVVLDGVGTLRPLNGTVGGFDFWSNNAGVLSCASQAIACEGSGPVPSMGTAPWDWFSNFGTAGLRMPGKGNNDNCDIVRYTSQGDVNGIWISEHANWLSGRVINSYTGIVVYSGDGSAIPADSFGHVCSIFSVSVENVQNALAAGDAACHVEIWNLDCETVDGNVVNDGSNALTGNIRYNCTTSPGGGAVNGGSHVTVTNTG